MQTLRDKIVEHTTHRLEVRRDQGAARNRHFWFPHLLSADRDERIIAEVQSESAASIQKD